MKEPQNYNLFAHMLVLLRTLLGAVASYAYQILNGDEFRWSILYLQAIVAIFADTLVLLSASYYPWTTEFAGGVAGLLEKRTINKITDPPRRFFCCLKPTCLCVNSPSLINVDLW